LRVRNEYHNNLTVICPELSRHLRTNLLMGTVKKVSKKAGR
jgi:hypothetical protein